MKSNMRILIALTIAAMFVTFTGCATSQKKTQQQYSGFLKTYPDFVKGPEGIDKRWLKPGVDFSKYDKIMMDEVQFFLAPDADYKGISPSIAKELGEDFHKSFIKEMGDMLTASPGPDVARMRLAVTDIEQSKPAVGTITTVVPVGLAVSLVKKGATGEYTGIGSASMEVEFLDSMTNERIAAAVDKSPGGKLDVGKYSPAKAAFEYWAKRLHAFMQQTKVAKAAK